MVADRANPQRKNPDSLAKGDVGKLLQACRKRRGESLSEVSVTLKIRLPYLEAIEDSRHDDLPGKFYSAGFIRTYAEYLGLDSEEIVRRLKLEQSALAEKTSLTFPATISEDSVPGKYIFASGILIAVIGYGVWLTLSNSNVSVTEVPEIVQQAPDKMPKGEPPNPVDTTLANASPSTIRTKKQLFVEIPVTENASNEKTTEVDKRLNTIETRESSEKQVAMISKLETTQRLGSIPPTKINAENSTTPGISELQKNIDPSDSINRGSSDREIPTVKVRVNTAPRSPEITGSIPRKNLEFVLPEPEEKRVSVPNTPPQPDPLQASLDDGAPDRIPSLPSRPTSQTIQTLDTTSDPGLAENMTNSENPLIVLTAKTESWIEITDIKTGDLIVSKVLTKDHSYQVPRKQGLSLMTGNAGALEISVDGTIVPTIGKLGEIRQDILLNEATLRKIGAAVD